MCFYHCNHHCAIVSLHLSESKLSTIFYKIYWSLIAVLAMKVIKKLRKDCYFWKRPVVSQVHDPSSQLCSVDPFLFTIGVYWLYNCLSCPIVISCWGLPSVNLFFSYLLSFHHFPSLGYAHTLSWSLREKTWKQLLLVPPAWGCERIPDLCCSGTMKSNVRSPSSFLNLPVILLIIEELSVDKALLWNDRNQGENTKEKVQSPNDQCGTQ